MKKTKFRNLQVPSVVGGVGALVGLLLSGCGKDNPVTPSPLEAGRITQIILATTDDIQLASGSVDDADGSKEDPLALSGTAQRTTLPHVHSSVGAYVPLVVVKDNAGQATRTRNLCTSPNPQTLNIYIRLITLHSN